MHTRSGLSLLVRCLFGDIQVAHCDFIFIFVIFYAELSILFLLATLFLFSNFVSKYLFCVHIPLLTLGLTIILLQYYMIFPLKIDITDDAF